MVVLVLLTGFHLPSARVALDAFALLYIPCYGLAAASNSAAPRLELIYERWVPGSAASEQIQISATYSRGCLQCPEI